MNDGPYLQVTISRQVKQYLPNLIPTRFANLIWMITGVHLARHVHLSKIAAWRAGRATLNSKVRQLRRFLANPAIDSWRLYRPLARLLLGSGIPDSPIRLLIDRLELSGRRSILMVALAYRRRALPLTWEVFRKKGHSLAVDQVELLKRLQPLIPKERQVILFGDGEFQSIPLFVWLINSGWNFRLRVDRTRGVYLPTGQRRKVCELTEEGITSTQPVRIRLPIGYWPVFVGCYPEEPRPGYVISSTPVPGGITRDYRRRMWIEELFADLQGGGFQLQASRLYHPQRLSRLLVPLCWAYVWLIHVGGWIIKRGLRRLVDRNDRRDRSLVEIGRYWIRRRLAARKPLRMGFTPVY